MRSIREITTSAIAARSEWLEDVIAGLIINGVREDEITVADHNGLAPSFTQRTVVSVRGEPKYEWKLVLTRA